MIIVWNYNTKEDCTQTEWLAPELPMLTRFKKLWHHSFIKNTKWLVLRLDLLLDLLLTFYKRNWHNVCTYGKAMPQFNKSLYISDFKRCALDRIPRILVSLSLDIFSCATRRVPRTHVTQTHRRTDVAKSTQDFALIKCIFTF